MAGIYIHIPYCRKACHYCNFHFSTTRYNAREMVDCIQIEAVRQRGFLLDSPVPVRAAKDAVTVDTIYFGGGTPSLLPPDWIQELTDCIKAAYPVTNTAEITLEANPDDIHPEALHQWQSAGINRLSIGVQSFIQEDLVWMNRAHNAGQANTAVTLAQQAGFTNISLDLIYGTPYLSDQGWLENLEKVAALKVPHFSAYALTVEPRTSLFKMIEKGKIPPVDGAKQTRQFELLMDFAAKSEFEHYEISNLALAGHRSRHNSHYWKGVPYLGLGPAAHSYNGGLVRKWNIESNPLYIRGIREGKDVAASELLSPDNLLNEMIMIQLRCMEGLDLTLFTERFGETARAVLLQKAKTALIRGQLVIENGQLLLTRQGKHFADSVAVDLFV